MTVGTSDTGTGHGNETPAGGRATGQWFRFQGHAELELIPADRGVEGSQVDIWSDNSGFEDADDLAERSEKRGDLEMPEPLSATEHDNTSGTLTLCYPSATR